jgi:hypothetical protein
MLVLPVLSVRSGSVRSLLVGPARRQTWPTLQLTSLALRELNRLNRADQAVSAVQVVAAQVVAEPVVVAARWAVEPVAATRVDVRAGLQAAAEMAAVARAARQGVVYMAVAAAAAAAVRAAAEDGSSPHRSRSWRMRSARSDQRHTSPYTTARMMRHCHKRTREGRVWVVWVVESKHNSGEQQWA